MRSRSSRLANSISTLPRLAVMVIDTRVSVNHCAFLDAVTNRTLFLNRLSEAVQTAADSRHPFAVCVLDIDNFRRVNDTLGHWAGDALLIEIARRLPRIDGGSHMTARIGSDAFCMLLEHAGRPSCCAVSTSSTC